MWVALGTFFLSLLGIIALFGAKTLEARRGAALYPSLRARADTWALRLRELILALQADIEKLPGETLHISRIALHEVALATAVLLRFLERKLHELADIVSHKHRFERRAPRSEFLKKVAEHRNGSGSTKDEPVDL